LLSENERCHTLFQRLRVSVVSELLVLE